MNKEWHNLHSTDEEIVIVYAVNNHSGGGKVILDRILVGHEFGPVHFAFVDLRYQLNLNLNLDLKNVKFIFVKPTICGRFLAEWQLFRLSKKNPKLEILSLTNMPPIFRLSGKSSLFFQNALLLPGKLRFCKNWRHRFRTAGECLILHLFHRNLDQMYVQTNWVKQELAVFFNKPILLHPIYPEAIAQLCTHDNLKKSIDFIAVSGCVDYKNLYFLLVAWMGLSQLKNKKLVLVVDALMDRHLQQLRNLHDQGFSVEVYQNISRQKIYDLYQASRCLIMCSSVESFCLPLYEAKIFSLQVIAPDLPYVQEAQLPQIIYYKDLNIQSFQSAIANGSKIIDGV